MNISTKQKIVNKITHLKNKNRKVIDRLESVDLKKEFGDSYISPYSFNTIHDIERMIKRMKSCMDSLHIQTNDNDDFKILEKSCCNIHSICHVCASAKRNKIQSEIKPYISTMLQMPFNFYMVTATIENVKDAGAGYEDLRKYWTDFNKMGQKRQDGKNSKGEASKFEASIFSLETVKDNHEDSLYHVHAHILIISRHKLDYTVYNQVDKRRLEQKYGKNNIPKKELSKIAMDYIVEYDKDGNEVKLPCSKIQKEWYTATRGKGKNIDVRPIYDGKLVKKKGVLKKVSLESQLYEIVKYETKPLAIENPIDLINIWDSVSGKRRTTRAGLFTMKFLDEWEQLLEEHDLTSYFWELYYKDTEFSNIFTQANTESYEWVKPPNEMFDPYHSIGKNVIAPSFANKEELSCKKRYQMKAVNIYRQKLKEHRLRFESGEFNAMEFVQGKEYIYSAFKNLTAIVQKQWNFDNNERKMIMSLREGIQMNCFKDVVDEIIQERLKKYNRPSNFLEPTYYPKEVETTV